MAHRGMKLGIFLAPFHRVGENPTLAIRKAYADAGRPVPKEFLSRTSGGADAGPIVPGGA